MSAIITTYLLSDPDQVAPMNRDEFYASQIDLFHKGQKPNRASSPVQVLLFTPDKEIILQKRAKTKGHNAGLIDKAIGGHILFGNSSTYTVLTETLQELNTPSIVLDSEEDFNKTYKLLGSYLSTVALLQFVDSKIIIKNKKIGDEMVPIANKYYFYLGVYGGSIKPADKEASGIMYYTLDQLEEEMKNTPQLFTDDLRFFLEKYSSKISQFLKSLG